MKLEPKPARHPPSRRRARPKSPHTLGELPRPRSPSAVPAQNSPLLADPRKEADFTAKHYPTADGQAGPAPADQGRAPHIKREFLAVYYRLNCARAEVLKNREPRRAVSRAGRAKERAAGRRIKTLLRLRDALEDQYAPYGIVAEPVVHKGLTVDVKFQLGPLDPGHRPGAWEFCLSSHVAIPMPPRMRAHPPVHLPQS
ncbi:MAG: hypothetical protein HYY24_18365 [Verrucomicrobia bacterium]|nr:hypothetical protein [Verrucomicrobiota bacterium]